MKTVGLPEYQDFQTTEETPQKTTEHFWTWVDERKYLVVVLPGIDRCFQIISNFKFLLQYNLSLPIKIIPNSQLIDILPPSTDIAREKVTGANFDVEF